MKAAIAACLALVAPLAAMAAPDPAEGEKLVETHKCETCHQAKVQGPAGTIYTRKDRRVQTWPRLRSQVALCNSQLNIGLFPEEEEHVAAHLNARWYKLPTK